MNILGGWLNYFFAEDKGIQNFYFCFLGSKPVSFPLATFLVPTLRALYKIREADDQTQQGYLELDK